jgi:AcrR family transcriptional regulator
VSTVEGLRERKKERTRDAIRDAAHDLFVERGFAGTTVDDIAAAADVSPRTFFRYFASKEEVLFSSFDETLEILQAFLHSRPAGESVAESLRVAAAEFATLGGTVSGDTATFDIYRSTEALNARYLQSFFHLESMFAEWLGTKLGRPADDLLPRTLAAVVASGARVALDVWAEEAGHDLQDLLQPTLAMVGGALEALGASR